MIADLVPRCESLCDIGTDHAYVAIYLAKKGIAQKIIAADIKKGPLAQADKNIALFEVSDKIETRLSNGFEKIAVGEVQCAIIAGEKESRRRIVIIGSTDLYVDRYYGAD